MESVLLNDTSVLLNLLATGQFESITASFSIKFAICSTVQVEAKTLRDSDSGEMIPVDITPLISSGILEVLYLEGEDEQNFYLAQLSIMDDGEAMSFAIAASRGMDLALDDKRAQKLIKENCPLLKLWSTPHVIKHWAENAKISLHTLSESIQRIENRARYFPAKTHPLYDWWQSSKLL